MNVDNQVDEEKCDYFEDRRNLMKLCSILNYMVTDELGLFVAVWL